MKHLVMIFILMFTMPAMAAVDTKGLSSEQKAKLVADAAQMKLTNSQTISTGDMLQDAIDDPSIINKYAQMGQAIASSLAAAARELGVEVNKFAESDVGRLILYMTIYHFFGADIITFFAGFFFMIPLSLWIIYRMNKMIKTAEIKYDEKGKEIGRRYHTAEEASLSRGDGMSGFGAQCIVTVIGMILIVLQAFIYLP